MLTRLVDFLSTKEKSMRVQILAYGLSWNPKNNRGDISLRLQNGQVVKVPVETAEEFTAVSTILNESPVFLETTNGLITTEWEQTGGA